MRSLVVAGWRGKRGMHDVELPRQDSNLRAVNRAGGRRWSLLKAEVGAVPNLGRNERGDARDRPEAIELEILQRHLNAELLLQLSQEFYERERVHQPGVDQVRVERRDLKVQLLSEQGGDLLREFVRVRHVTGPDVRSRVGRRGGGPTDGHRYSDTAAAGRWVGSGAPRARAAPGCLSRPSTRSPPRARAR